MKTSQMIMEPIPAAALPDYDRIGSDFDLWLPLIAPVTSALLGHLPALPEGASVLDVACGTGEPGLTLARRSPGVRVLGENAVAILDRHVVAGEGRETGAKFAMQRMERGKLKFRHGKPKSPRTDAGPLCRLT